MPCTSLRLALPPKALASAGALSEWLGGIPVLDVQSDGIWTNTLPEAYACVRALYNKLCVPTNVF